MHTLRSRRTPTRHLWKSCLMTSLCLEKGASSWVLLCVLPNIAMSSNIISIGGVLVFVLIVFRKPLENKHRHHQHRLHQYYDELDYALDQNNSAEAWRLTRRICSALKGSRRKFIHFPRCNVTCQQFYDRYAQAPNMGGGLR